MPDPKLTDEDLLTIWEGLWVEDDRRLDLFDEEDLATALRITNKARAVLQPIMDERGLHSEMEDHIVGVDRFRREMFRHPSD